MRVLKEAGHTSGGRVVALGMFDGVHLGHQALLREAVRLARELGVPARACTFDRHPLEVIAPERVPAQLTTLEEKTRKMAALGLDELLILPFNRKEADTEPEEFLAWLRETADLKAVVAGWNYTFGRGGRGNAELLIRDGQEHGYLVRIMDPVRTPEGEVISSSLIREKMMQGDAETARKLLG